LERGLKPLLNDLLVIIIKIILTTNYQLLLNCNKVHRAGHESHVGIVIILMILLKALIVKLFGGKASIIILERILNIQERLPTSSTRKKLVSHTHPK
jgi:hypothetical protein